MSLTKINEVVYIPIDMIDVNPHQPRKNFNDEDIEKLADSIKSYGVLQPVSVRKINDRYELIIGERRTRASVRAGVTHVPAIVVEVDDEDSAVAALIENVLRVDLSFLEEAEAMKNLLDQHGVSQTELSKTFGLSQSAISNKIRVLNLPDKIKIRLAESKLSERHARALLRVSGEDEMNSIVDRIVEDGLSVKKTEELIERRIRQNEDIRRKERSKNIKSSINYKIYANTIRNAFNTVNESNPTVSLHESEYDDYYEMIVRIPKKEKK